jgi:hypothetical protein
MASCCGQYNEHYSYTKWDEYLEFLRDYCFETVVLWDMTPCVLSDIRKCFKENCVRHFGSFPYCSQNGGISI